jgi:hypothetical protein
VWRGREAIGIGTEVREKNRRTSKSSGSCPGLASPRVVLNWLFQLLLFRTVDLVWGSFWLLELPGEAKAPEAAPKLGLSH